MSRVLADLTQRKLPSQHSGTLTLLTHRPGFGRTATPKLREGCVSDKPHRPKFDYVVRGEPFLPENVIPGVSRGTERMCAAKPDTRKPYERIFDSFRTATPAQRRGAVRPLHVPYKPQDGNQAGPLFWFYCRETGARLVSCRGVIHHVMGEAEKFAKAQGLTIADIFVGIEP